jgi:hypothetical protein
MYLSAVRFDLTEALTIAAVGGVLIFLLSFLKWRAAVKTAFVLVLFEGAIRKWALPGQQELVYFLKDFILAGAYVRFFLFPDPEVRAKHLAAPVFIVGLLCAIVSISAINPNIRSVIIAIYGLKIYFYYIPLAFMMPYLFRTPEDLVRGVSRFALLATPICLLGVAQFAAPSASILNIYAENTDDSIITTFAGEDIARITGTFSYLTGHTTFVVMFFALHLALLTTKQPRYRWLWLLGNVPLLTANAFMGGSRACVVTVVAIAMGYVILTALKGASQQKAKAIVVALAACLASIISLMIFSDAFDQWRLRNRTASDTYWDRVYVMPMEALDSAVDSQGLFGYGIGVSHPVVYRLRTALNLPPAKTEPPLFDTEPARVLVELGIVGFLAWYGLRFLVLRQSYRTYSLLSAGDLKSIFLAVVLIQPPFFLMSLVLNHTASFLLWGAYGLTLMPWLSPVHALRGRTKRPPNQLGVGSQAPHIPNRRAP